jgi:hypothetical protein
MDRRAGEAGGKGGREKAICQCKRITEITKSLRRQRAGVEKRKENFVNPTLNESRLEVRGRKVGGNLKVGGGKTLVGSYETGNDGFELLEKLLEKVQMKLPENLHLRLLEKLLENLHIKPLSFHLLLFIFQSVDIQSNNRLQKYQQFPPNILSIPFLFQRF